MGYVVGLLEHSAIGLGRRLDSKEAVIGFAELDVERNDVPTESDPS